MKAILINTLQHGGAERIAINIARHLKSKGEKISLVVLARKEKQYPVEDLDVHYLSNKSDLKRGFSFKKLLSYPLLLIRLGAYIRSNNIALVQSHLFTASILNVLSRFLFCRHKVQIVNHMLVSYERKEKIKGRIKIAALKFTYRRAELLISISEKMKKDIDNHLLKSSNVKHIVIPNPHDIKEIIKNSQEKVTNFAFKSNKKYISASGRLVSRKRLNILIEAFAIIEKDFPHLEILILGSGPEFSKLEEQASNLQVRERVHFVGYVENPFNFISNSHIYALTSESEGLPNALIEAMICSKPVISSDCPTGPREILAPGTDFDTVLNDTLEKGEYGILFPVDDSLLLAEAIKEVLENYEQYSLKSMEAFEYVQKYNLPAIMSQYEVIMLSK